MLWPHSGPIKCKSWDCDPSICIFYSSPRNNNASKAMNHRMTVQQQSGIEQTLTVLSIWFYNIWSSESSHQDKVYSHWQQHLPPNSQSRGQGINTQLKSKALQEKEGHDICDIMDGTWGHYAEWNMSDRERKILYDIICVWNLKESGTWRSRN